MKKSVFLPFLLLAMAAISTDCHAQIINTIVGDSTGYNGDGIPAIHALINRPQALATDKAGNIYIADAGNSRIRKVDLNGTITTIAGTGEDGYSGDGGPATAARIHQPFGMAVDNSGNLYFVDNGNNCVRKISSSGIITLIAGFPDSATNGFAGDGGQATAALLKYPTFLTIDKSNNVYISDGGNGRVRKVSSTGIISTFAGSDTMGFLGDGGPAIAARLSSPGGVSFDPSGSLCIVDGNRIRKVNTSGIISTIVGNGTAVGPGIGDGGPATDAFLNLPEDVAIDKDGNIYISDTYNGRIRKVNASGIISSVAGSSNASFTASGDGGYAGMALLGATIGLAIDHNGNLLLTDYDHSRIRAIRYAVSTPQLEKNEETISVSPNPSNGVFDVKVVSAVNEELKICVMNIAGQKVKEVNYITNSATTIELDAPAGLYFVVATSSTQKWMKQVVKN